MSGQPAYWNAYVPPTTHVAAAIQYPVDAKWPDRLITAYIKDWRESRRALQQEEKR